MRDPDPANQRHQLADYRNRHDLAGGVGMPPTPAKGIVSVFSENRKEGYWALPRHLRVLSVFGNVTVDLREASAALPKPNGLRGRSD